MRKPYPSDLSDSGVYLAMVVQGVKPFIERLLAQRVEIPLATVRGKARVYVCWDDRRGDIP